MAGEQLPLELNASSEPPRLIAATLLEGGALRARVVPGAPEVRFASFLDGTQKSRAVAYVAGLPIVHATVAAVVRRRRDRRMVTWAEPVVRSRLYSPRSLLPPDVNEALETFDMEVVDTTEGRSGEAALIPHPYAVADAAVHRIQDDREAAERSLADRWCLSETDPLLVDGGISGTERAADSPWAVGVVKSHRSIYAEGEALRVVLTLRRGERSSVFRITSRKRTAVASWYLRLRDPSGRDPMWGLVRIEVADLSKAGEDVTARADEVSRWVLAEVTPLSLPDGRWDKMVYPVYDCEQYLKSLV